jgi:hypothetical protein
MQPTHIIDEKVVRGEVVLPVHGSRTGLRLPVLRLMSLQYPAEAGALALYNFERGERVKLVVWEIRQGQKYAGYVCYPGDHASHCRRVYQQLVKAKEHPA